MAMIEIKPGIWMRAITAPASKPEERVQHAAEQFPDTGQDLSINCKARYGEAEMEIETLTLDPEDVKRMLPGGDAGILFSLLRAPGCGCHQ